MVFSFNSSLFHVLLLLLLSFSPWPILSVQLCPNCGSTPVPYPLSTGPNCCDQFYKVRCDGAGKLMFDSLNNTYPITSVSPHIRRLTIQPAPFFPNTCITTDVFTHGVQLNPALPFNITSSNTIFYLNCSDISLRSPLNCSSKSLCHTFVNGTTSDFSRRGACGGGGSLICCSFGAGGSSTAYSIRVRNEGCRAYRSFVNLDYSLPVNEWPEPALELQWSSPSEPICLSQSDCDSDSTCELDPSSNNGVRRCFCNSGFRWDDIAGLCSNLKCQDSDGCGSSPTGLIAGSVAGTVVGLLLVLIVYFFYRRERHIKETQERLARDREEILNSNGGKSVKLFTGKEIKKATNNFSEELLLGAGGYGEVYKGILDNGTIVAIKCAKLGNTKGTDQVLNEVRILCQVNHKNLVRILGCCVELEQPLIVYEYISNGTLSDHLQNSKKNHMTWFTRLNIAQATAEGLAYLHFSAVPPIYHRDVKSSNILVDEKMNAKVSDFGLSRLARADLSHVSTCAQGTLGYLDPEYHRNYQLTDKSDVYSFGVVLLELLTSQKAIDFDREQDDVNLAIYARRLVEEDKLMDAVDRNLKNGANNLELETMKALGLLALGCLEEHRQNRPSMKEVAEEIEYIIRIATAKVLAL